MKVRQNVLAVLLFAGSLAAQPQGFYLAGGEASPPILDAQGNMVIQSGLQAIVNWDTFSIAAAEQIHFHQQGATSSILNRVTGNQGSDLLGLLSSNGRVFLINPNGVFIGQTGRIETVDFLASTFDVFDADFLQEKDLLFCGDSRNSIQNLGTISCPTGNIHLFAAQVVNEGALQAFFGKVFIAAGGDVLLQKDGSSHIFIRPELSQEEIVGAAIDNQGSIEAMVASLQAGDSPYAKAIRCSGQIDATTLQEIGGKIYLVAEKGITEIDGGSLKAAGGIVHVLGEKVALQNNSRIDVSAPSGGGTVLIGGDLRGENPDIQNAIFTYISKDSVIKADAIDNGDGGKVIVWGDEGTFAYGKISARGGQNGGNGGFNEVSGNYLDFQGLSDTTAPNGRIGTLLLDPQTITISTAVDSGFTPPFNFDGPICNGTATGTLDGTLSGNTSNIQTSVLVTQLGSTCVTINTSASGAGAGGLGTITVSAASPITWSAPTTLTLIADSNIVINSAISNTDTFDPAFTAMNFTAKGNRAASFDGINVAAALSCSGAGSINLTGQGGTGSSNVGVFVNATITTASGNVTLTGTGGSGAAGTNLGLDIFHLITTTSGNITLTGTGGSADSSFGVQVNPGANLTSSTGNIAITATGGPGTDSVGFVPFNITIQTGGSGTIVITGSSLVDPTQAGSSLDTTTVISENGNISIIGPFGAGGGSSALTSLITNGTGSISFSSFVSGSNNENAGPSPLLVRAGGSVTFSGAITSDVIGQFLTALTVQAGSGFSTSPTLGTIPAGTITFGGSSVAVTGAISLNAAGRAIPMSIATIIGTGNLSISAGSLSMGVNESMTVLGNLTFASSGALNISDIVAAGNLALSGSSITLNPQAPGTYLASTGKFYTSPNAHIIGLNSPTVSPAVSPAGSRVLASGFPTETSFAKVLTFGGAVLNYDIHGSLPPLAQAAVNEFAVANSQVVANGPWGLLPILDLRFFPIYAICPVNTKKKPCATGVFVPFIYESDIIDGNFFRSL